MNVTEITREVRELFSRPDPLAIRELEDRVAEVAPNLARDVRETIRQQDRQHLEVLLHWLAQDIALNGPAEDDDGDGEEVSAVLDTVPATKT